MPVSVVCETTASVNAALRESLGSSGVSCSQAANAKATSADDGKTNGSSTAADDVDTLHGKLVASAKRVLLSKIDYEEVTNYGQTVLDTLKSKYIVLKPSANNNSMENGRNSPATCNNNNNGANGDSAAGKCTCYILFPFIFFFLFVISVTIVFFEVRFSRFLHSYFFTHSFSKK